MSNIEVNTISDNAIKGVYKANNDRTPIALPDEHSDDNESSGKSKKSKRFLFNKMSSTSPKLKSSNDINKMNVKEKISFYNSLSQKEKDEVNSKTAEILTKYVNSLPKDKKAEFTSNFNKALKNAKSPDISEVIYDVNDQYNGDITPRAIAIMGLICSAYIGNMNTEALDELEQIMQSNMINTYLNNVKNQINAAMKNNKNLATGLTSGMSKGEKWFAIGMLIATVVILVVVGVLTFGVGDAAVGTEVLGEEVPALTETLSEAPEGALGDSEGVLPKDKPTTSPEQSEGRFNSIKQGFKNKWQAIKRTFSKSTDDISKSENGAKPTDDPENARKTRPKYRFKFNKENAKTFVKYGGPVALGSIGATSAGLMLFSSVGQNGSIKSQAELQQFQLDVKDETTQSDILNNAEQTATKRVSDDSQRVSQSSGTAQQAINMIAQAMSMRA